ncbi:hypothetical protein D7147_01740 [Micromonospora musae]|uniref:Translation initiation factor 2 n=1 Tax=Micromonospora musae TaxID=1894970 RepID=A0ABX9RIT3_9ACTN|nr:hypothetical protein D7147_01740 [Micromonospora musae]
MRPGRSVASCGRVRRALVASDGVTTPSGGSSPDDFWRRPPSGGEGLPDRATAPITGDGTPPAGGAAPGANVGPGGATYGGYTGPPPSTPPPAGWRPPIHLQPAAPRSLPPQDMAALDQAEQRAQRVTYSIGAVAAVVLVILVCLLCSRLLR